MGDRDSRMWPLHERRTEDGSTSLQKNSRIDQGEKKFMPYIKFREKSHKDAFCEMAKKAIAKWCEENSSSAPKVEETPKQDSLPF